MSLVSFQTTLREFKNKFFHGEITRFAIQMCEIIDGKPKLNDEGNPSVGYFAIKNRPLSDVDLVKHFSQKPKRSKRFIYGSLAVCGTFGGYRCKWIVIDCDSKEELDPIKEKLLPYLTKLNISYIYESSGKGNDRAHIWIMCDLPVDIAKSFTNFIFQQTELPLYKYEVYPINRAWNNIRLPGGYHIKNGKANEILWKEQWTSNPEEIMSAFIDCPAITEEMVSNLLPEEPVVQKRKKQLEQKEFLYIKRHLKTPIGLPSVIEDLASNCQAIKYVIEGAMSRHIRLIDKRGGLHHRALLFLNNLALFNDKRLGDESGRKWLAEFFQKHRYRNVESHNLNTDLESVKDPRMLVARCQIWEEDFDACKGCVFKDREEFRTPRQFVIGGRPVRTRLIEPISLVNPKDLDELIFNPTREKIMQLITQKAHADIVLAPPLESGKSYFSDELTAQLVAHGKKILISVQTVQLALEHAKRLLEFGVKPFLLVSHENIFKKDEITSENRFELEFECPVYDEIHQKIKLGIAGSILKKKFCKKCPFKENCPYPNQYAEVLNDKHKVVILQHSYFAVEEVMGPLLRKNFDLLIIDENFIQSILKRIKPTTDELSILEQSGMEWAESLASWLKKGGLPNKSTLYASESDRATLKATLEALEQPWNVPDYIRMWNTRKFSRPGTGLTVFYELPNIPIRLITNATPPIEMLNLVLNTGSLDVIGKDIVIDYRVYNPKNKIIQIVDGSSSRTSMERDDRFWDLVEKSADLSRSRYQNKKLLWTTYKALEGPLNDWLGRNYPDVLDRSLISHREVGTNRFQDREVQFVFSGVFPNTKQLKLAAYELKSIENYWRALADEPLIANSFPTEVTEISGTEMQEELVRKLTTIDDYTGIYEFPDFKTFVPTDFHQNLIVRNHLSEILQGMRIRFRDGLAKEALIFTNHYLHFFVDEVIMESDFLCWE